MIFIRFFLLCTISVWSFALPGYYSSTTNEYLDRVWHKHLVSFTPIFIEPKLIKKGGSLKVRASKRAWTEARELKKNPDLMLSLNIVNFDFSKDTTELQQALTSVLDKINLKHIHFINLSNNNLGDKASEIIAYLSGASKKHKANYKLILRSNNISNLNFTDDHDPVLLQVGSNPKLNNESIERFFSSQAMLINIDVNNNNHAQVIAENVKSTNARSLYLNVAREVDEEALVGIISALKKSKIQSLSFNFNDGYLIKEKLFAKKLSSLIRWSSHLSSLSLNKLSFSISEYLGVITKALGKSKIRYLNLDGVNVINQPLEKELFSPLKKNKYLQFLNINQMFFKESISQVLTEILNSKSGYIILAQSVFNKSPIIDELSAKFIKQKLDDKNILAIQVNVHDKDSSVFKLMGNTKKTGSLFASSKEAVAFYLAAKGKPKDLYKKSKNKKSDYQASAPDILPFTYTIDGTTEAIRQYANKASFNSVTITPLLSYKNLPSKTIFRNQLKSLLKLCRTKYNYFSADRVELRQVSLSNNQLKGIADFAKSCKLPMTLDEVNVEIR